MTTRGERKPELTNDSGVIYNQDHMSRSAPSANPGRKKPGPKPKPKKPCTAIVGGEPCPKFQLARGYCSCHYQQDRRGEPFTPVRHMRPRGSTTFRDADGNKECGTCRGWYPETSFYAGSALDGLQHQCKGCSKRAYNDRALSDPINERRRHIRSKYGISLEEWGALFAAQGSKCAICNSLNPRGIGWHVDHDHACHPKDSGCRQCVRGILCSPCNQALGLMKDDPARMLAAIAYLKEPPSAHIGLGPRANAA